MLCDCRINPFKQNGPQDCIVDLIPIWFQWKGSEDADDEEKDKFYEDLEEEWRKLTSYDVKILMGDFNAKIGREHIWKEVAGTESLHEISNDNGVRLLSLAGYKSDEQTF